MTHKITASVIAFTLLTSGAFISAPASAQDGRKFVAQNARNSVAQNQTKMWGRTSANQHRAGNQYRAGLRAGLDRAGVRARASYDRGYGDGSYRQGYGPRVNYASSYAREDGAFDPRRYDGYSPYARYDGSYEPRGYYGYRPHAGYDPGFNPVAALLGGIVGLSVAAAPVPSRLEQANAADWVAYCSSRYRSFDPASGTFLANDGNRYYCS